MDSADLFEPLREAVALWYVGRASAADVVRAACDLLVAGVDRPGLAMLAAVPFASADTEVPELLESLSGDLGIDHHPRDTAGAQMAALRLMARRTLGGQMAPAELTAWVHEVFGHYTFEPAARLAQLEDSYELVEYLDETVEDVDAQVLAEARRILGGPPGT